jgi:prophage tail gpP-like protein
MTLEANGVTYDGFTSARTSVCMEDLSGEFSFSSVNIKNIFTPIKIGDKCKIYVNGKSVINGYVEKIDADYDVKSHNIFISGRDKTCDVIDSSVGDKITFSGGISLVEMTKQTLAKMNITGINVSTTVSMDPFKSSELENSEVCETVHTFLLKYAKKRQVLMTTDGSGNIIFVRSSKNTIKTVLTSSYNSKSTILNAAVKFDDTKRFYKYILNSQVNPSSLGDDPYELIKAEKAYNVAAVAYDTDIRPSRTYNFQAETPHKETATSPLVTKWSDLKAYSSSAIKAAPDADKRTIWESNIRRARALTYTCSVYGFSPIDDPNIIWRPNLLVNVIDEILNFTSQLLIRSVVYDYSLDEGSKTTLELVDKQTFDLELIVGIKEKKTKSGAVEGYDFNGVK